MSGKHDIPEVIHDVTAGGTRSVLRVHREPGGRLVIAGQDLGVAPLEVFGDSDYEYWITIGPKHAAGIDIATLRAVAAGDPGGSLGITRWLRERGIGHRIETYA